MSKPSILSDQLTIALLIIIHREIVKQLIETPQWPLLMRQTFTDFESDKETTPFREMIKKMPGKYIYYGQPDQAGREIYYCSLMCQLLLLRKRERVWKVTYHPLVPFEGA